MGGRVPPTMGFPPRCFGTPWLQKTFTSSRTRPSAPNRREEQRQLRLSGLNIVLGESISHQAQVVRLPGHPEPEESGNGIADVQCRPAHAE